MIESSARILAFSSFSSASSCAISRLDTLILFVFLFLMRLIRCTAILSCGFIFVARNPNTASIMVPEEVARAARKPLSAVAFWFSLLGGSHLRARSPSVQ